MEERLKGKTMPRGLAVLNLPQESAESPSLFEVCGRMPLTKLAHMFALKGQAISPLYVYIPFVSHHCHCPDTQPGIAPRPCSAWLVTGAMMRRARGAALATRTDTIFRSVTMQAW